MRKILFDFNSSVLRPEGAAVLAEAAKALGQKPDNKILIVGHACELGSPEYNLQLSEKRAMSAKLFLIYEGIDKSRLAAEGVGEECPVADTTSPSKHKLNRRIELFLIK